MMNALMTYSKEHHEFPVIEFLNQTTFDKLIAIDLRADKYKYVFSVDTDLWTPSMEGTFSTVFEHFANNIIHPDDQSLYRETLDPKTIAARLDKSNGLLSLTFRSQTQDGEWRWCEQFVVDGQRQEIPDDQIYFYIYDVQTRIDRETGKTLISGERRIQHDPVTGLPREYDFYSIGESMLEDTTINWLFIAIDLQHFNLFNEWYGRKLGDQILNDIGATLTDVAKTCGGVAGYMGGDDFAILIPKDSLETAALFATLQEIIHHHGVSIGFLPALGACYSNGGTSIYRLYDEASLACQEAKKDYRSRVVFFSSSLVEQTTKDYKILSEFREALDNGDITFFLQPQCRATSGQIVGAEVLARWIKPDGTIVPPLAYIPTLELYGFIPDLDKFIWEEACKWARRSLDKGNPLIPISVNISPVDIFAMDIPEFFEGLIRKYDLPKNAIKVEITESAYGEDSDRVRAAVQKFRDLGFAVLMDDFGSGFSSLNMLRELSVDMIKLDAYFLRLEEGSRRKGMNIIESVVNMAKTMSIPIIVEGVETDEHRAYLMSLGCRYIQGYFFYKPMPTDEFDALISRAENVDAQGFTFKFNEEFRIQEFINNDVYSDSMLNHIIGPAAIYAWHGDDVDIVRFNQEFYQAANITDFDERLTGIQQFMPAAEVPLLYEALQEAYDDELNGSSATLTFVLKDSSMMRFLIQFYFLNNDGTTKRFYGSARDVTEIAGLQQQMNLLSQFVSRTVLFMSLKDDLYSFEVIAHGLEDAMGLTKDEMEHELNESVFYKRLIPKREMAMWNIAFECIETKQSTSRSFRMQGANGNALDFVVDADYVDDPIGNVVCILALRKIEANSGK